METRRPRQHVRTNGTWAATPGRRPTRAHPKTARLTPKASPLSRLGKGAKTLAKGSITGKPTALKMRTFARLGKGALGVAKGAGLGTVLQALLSIPSSERQGRLPKGRTGGGTAGKLRAGGRAETKRFKKK